MDRLEAKLLRPKPWALQGEVAGNQRPTNSLLEDDFAVEHAMKQVPVITPETTQALEDRIRRPGDRSWWSCGLPQPSRAETSRVLPEPIHTHTPRWPRLKVTPGDQP